MRQKNNIKSKLGSAKRGHAAGRKAAMRTSKTSRTMSSKSLARGKTFNRVGWGCLGAFGVLALVLMNPVNFGDADAAQNTTRVAETRAVVNAAASLSLTMNAEVQMDIMPTKDGTFGNELTKMTVSTNNDQGYNVYINTMDPTTSMTYYDTSKTGADYEVKALSGTATPGSFANNTWGFALTTDAIGDSTNYRGITTNEYLAKQTTTKSTTEYNLAFGAKVDTNLAAGQYANNVVVSVIANPLLLTNLSQLVYMQDMSSDICENTGNITPGNEITKQLIDIRDGKKYWVAKLADQNCWMTQNLALNLTQGQVLSPSTSDVSQDWTVPTTTSTEVPRETSIPSGSEEYWNTRSWNLGHYVLATPSRGVSCYGPPVEGSSNTDNYNSVRYGQTLDRCTDFQNVGVGWNPTFDAKTQGQNGTWNDYTGYVAADKATKTYDAHYLVGNYYQWNTATAGTGGKDVVSGTPAEGDTDQQLIDKLVDAKDSICPANWKLPTAGRNTAATSGQPLDREDSFYRLLLAYGYPKTGGYEINGGNGYTPILKGPNQNISESPIYLTRGGYVNITTGSLRGAGLSGYYWASTAYPSELYAYYLDFNSTNVFPSNNYNRWNGFTVRCLAK